MLKKLPLILAGCFIVLASFFVSNTHALTCQEAHTQRQLRGMDGATSYQLYLQCKNGTNAVQNATTNSSNNNAQLTEKERYCTSTGQSGINIDACRACYNYRSNSASYSSCTQRYIQENTPVPSTNGGDANGAGGTGNGGSSDGSGQTSGNASSNTTNSEDANTGYSSETANNNYADIVAPDTVFEGRTGESFLGLVSWDSGVKISDQDSLISGIWTIAANILVDITVIASYLVLGYVIYGGYLYTFSTGEAGKVETGKKTLSRAFLGLAIVLSANLIMNSIRFALLGASGKLTDCATSECVSPTFAVASLINWVIGIAGAVSVIFVVYGGIMYITSSGDAGRVEKAKKMITYSLIGLIIVALSVIITSFVTNTIRGNTPTAFTNTHQTIISKEAHDIKIS